MAAPVRSSDFIRDIQQHLDRPLLAPDLTWNEAGKFCDARVPPMPVIGSLAEWNSLAEKLRREVLDEVVFRGSLAQQWRDVKTGIVWGESMPGGPGYRLRKVRYEAVPGMWIPAILYEPEKLAGKMPVHLAVNGHTLQGKGAIYSQIRCINLAQRGIISLNPEWFSFGQLRTDRGKLAPTPDRGAAEGFKHDAMNQLDLCGVSGLAPFYLAMSRGLDLLLALPEADKERVAVSGLSGGGWQTIMISALDTRVTLCNPVAGYSSFRTWVSVPGMVGDSEQAPNDLGTFADYTHLTAMLAGRSVLLTYNAKDQCCFAAAQTLPPLLESAAPIFDLYAQASRLRTHVNYEPGTHNYERDNREAFYRVLGDWFFPDDKAWQAMEIPSDEEIKTNDALNVDMPANNVDFNQLARGAMQGLPLDPELVARDPSGARKKLREIVRSHPGEIAATQIGRERGSGGETRFWQLRVGGSWTVPVVEFTRGTPGATTIIISDTGRRNVAEEVERGLAAGRRVLAVDVYGFGEARIPRSPGRKDFA
ncbi:MAG: alpha/beta hydrolase family protein, partial [Opitutaceae bacterium]